MARIRHRRKTTKDDYLSVRVEADQLRRWRIAAEKDRRPLSQWVANILDDAADAAGVE